MSSAPPSSKAITGVPVAIASTGTMPKSSTPGISRARALASKGVYALLNSVIEAHLESYEVEAAVNSLRNDTPALLKPV
nr:hypothetical protein [Rhodococcus sp. ACPA4]